MNRKNNVVLAVLALVGSAAVSCVSDVGDPADEAGPGIAVRLTSLEAGSGRIEYSLTNHGPEPVRVLAWKGDQHPAHDPLFEVYRDGAKLAYRGPILHHGQPEQPRFLELAPGERRSAVIDLNELYDLRSGNTYEVRPLALQLSSGAGVAEIELDMGASLRIRVDASNTPRGVAEVGVSGAALTVENCAPDQTNMIHAGRAQALENAREAKDYIDEHQYDARAVRWFGEADIEGSYKVQDGMHVIHSLLEANTFRFVCRQASYYRCWFNTWAFVNPWDSSANKVINICPLGFTDAKPTGRDAFAVTITHEVAHFFTKDIDYEYDVGPALQLAVDDPNTARKNAENYALYTINSQIP